MFCRILSSQPQSRLCIKEYHPSDRDRKDIMELFPCLSAYMGHSELTSKLYYAHILPKNCAIQQGVTRNSFHQSTREGTEDED